MSGWANSDRKHRLPRDWHKRRAVILRRDPMCRIAGPGCTGRSTEVDHIHASGSDDEANLQGVCSHCHLRKTISERPASRLRRPPEPHPGLRS